LSKGKTSLKGVRVRQETKSKDQRTVGRRKKMPGNRFSTRISQEVHRGEQTPTGFYVNSIPPQAVIRKKRGGTLAGGEKVWFNGEGKNRTLLTSDVA